MTSDSGPRQYVETTRLEAFSDGVFAIAITLLVLDLAIGHSGDALDRVLDAWPFYLAYIVSFLTIGAAWLAHNAITDRLTKADSLLLRLNLLVLLLVSFLPFPTRLVAEGLEHIAQGLLGPRPRLRQQLLKAERPALARGFFHLPVPWENIRATGLSGTSREYRPHGRPLSTVRRWQGSCHKKFK